MKIQNEISVNKFGQNLIEIEQLKDIFNLFSFIEKKDYLNDILFMIMQSKAKDEDIEPAIEQSKLKKTYTPCILIKKGVANHNLQKLLELPSNELDKSHVLLLSLFRIAYKRRFDLERNHPDKWWYWDLSDEEKVKSILSQFNT